MELDNLAFGADGLEVERSIRGDHHRQLELLERAVRLASEILTIAEIGNREGRKLIAAGLLGRLVLAAQAGALLILRGLEHDAAISIRTCLELAAKLKACSIHPEFHRTYIASDIIRRLKLARGGLQLTGLTEDRRARLQALEIELSQQADALEARELKVEEVCRLAQMDDDYNSVFRLTSSAVHSAPRLLEDFIETHEGRVTGFNFEPRKGKASIYFATISEYLLRGTREFAQLVGVDRADTWNALWIDHQGSVPEWPQVAD